MKIRVNILFISLLVGFAFPCSCLEPPPPEEAYEDADVVLSGKVINMDLDDSGYYFEVSIQTIDVWKGDVLDEVIILTETSSDACGYNFQINNEYLIYAYSYNSGIYTNICTRTNLLEYASEDLDYLNGFNNNETSLEFEDEVQLFQDSAHQKFPELVSTDDGTLHLVWIRELGSNKNVMYSNSTDNGLTFSDPIQINHNSNSIVAYVQAGPKIKVRGNELLIVYMDHRSGLTNIYLNYSIDNGHSWGEDTLVSDQPYLQAYPDFEVAPNGIIHLIYYSYNQNNSFNSVRYSTAQVGSIEFSESTSVGVTGDANEPCDCCQPDMEISPEGDVYIAYRNNVENIRDIYIAIKAAGSDGFNNIIRASFHNDYNNHCPSSGPSMQIENNMIALSYRVSDAATSYIDYSDISILSFSNALMISSPEGSPNFPDILFDGTNVNEDIIHVGWIDYETGNPDVLYGAREIGAENLMNIQTMNQNIEESYIMQKDPKLHRHNDEIFYFWSDKRGTFYQLYYRKSASNYLLGDLNYDNSVDILDIIILVNHILSPAAIELDGADINNDGEVNILDIVALVNIILSN
jgi:hypothetical protein